MNRRQRQLRCKRHLPPSREWSALSSEQQATFIDGSAWVLCRDIWDWVNAKFR